MLADQPLQSQLFWTGAMETQTSYYNLEVGIEQALLYHSLYIFIDSKLCCGMWEHSLCCTSESANQRNATGLLLPRICGYLWALLMLPFVISRVAK